MLLPSAPAGRSLTIGLGFPSGTEMLSMTFLSYLRALPSYPPRTNTPISGTGLPSGLGGRFHSFLGAPWVREALGSRGGVFGPILGMAALPKWGTQQR